MKFQQFLKLITSPDGFVPTGHLCWTIRQNPRSTARQEAIAAEIIEKSNPRENITDHFPWGPEQQMILRQLWIHPKNELVEWRDVPIEDAENLFSTVDTKHGPLPVPNAINEPGFVKADFQQRIQELLGD